MSAEGYAVELRLGGITELVEGVEGVITERLDLFRASAGDERSFDALLVLREIDPAALVLDGYDLDGATGRVLLDGEVVLEGRATSPRWGRRGEPVRVTLVEAPWADPTIWPPTYDQRLVSVDQDRLRFVEAMAGGITFRGDPEAVGTSSLAHGVYSVRTQGRVGPMVFGAPGYQDGESWPATPAFWIAQGGSSGTVASDYRLQIARHRVAAGQVTVYGPCQDGEVRGHPCLVGHGVDDLGVTYAYAVLDPAHLGGQQGWTAQITWQSGAVYHPRGRGPGGDINHGSWTAGASPAALNASIRAWADAYGMGSAQLNIVTAGNNLTITIRAPLAGMDTWLSSLTSTPGALVTSWGNTNVMVPGYEPVPTSWRVEVDSDAWMVAWTHGEGLPGGAGDVIRSMLDQTAMRIDRGELESSRRQLNAYRLAGYLDAEVQITEWLPAQLEWLPMAWIQGRGGLRVWVYDPDAPPVAELVEDIDIDLDADPGLSTRAPVRQVLLSYRSRSDSGEPAMVTSQRSIYTGHAPPGAVDEVLSTDLVDDRATAEVAAALRQRALHRRHLVVAGTMARSWAWLRAGDVVDVQAPSVGVAGRGIVTQVADPGSGRIGVEISVTRDPERP